MLPKVNSLKCLGGVYLGDSPPRSGVGESTHAQDAIMQAQWIPCQVNKQKATGSRC